MRRIALYGTARQRKKERTGKCDGRKSHSLCDADLYYFRRGQNFIAMVFTRHFFRVLERLGAYAVLGLLFYLAYPRQVGHVCLLVFGSAVFLEILQIFVPDVPDRDARVVDALQLK